MIACEPKIFIGYKIHFFTDCYKEIIILHKWTCKKIVTYTKTLFSSKSWRSFSKERLHSTDTCHCSILINIEKNSNKRWGPLTPPCQFFAFEKHCGVFWYFQILFLAQGMFRGPLPPCFKFFQKFLFLRMFVNRCGFEEFWGHYDTKGL